MKLKAYKRKIPRRECLQLTKHVSTESDADRAKREFRTIPAEDILKLIKNNILEIIVKPNSKKQNITIQDNKIKVEIRSLPEENKANLEIIRIFEKISSRKVQIIKGRTSKNKVLRFN